MASTFFLYKKAM